MGRARITPTEIDRTSFDDDCGVDVPATIVTWSAIAQLCLVCTDNTLVVMTIVAIDVASADKWITLRTVLTPERFVADACPIDIVV